MFSGLIFKLEKCWFVIAFVVCPCQMSSGSVCFPIPVFICNLRWRCWICHITDVQLQIPL
uniref:Uncharacterized protein n=1 Tax=Anguilla anguilla TaxID=7936 RepID=A0A0E9RFT1_ANGAN